MPPWFTEAPIISNTLQGQSLLGYVNRYRGEHGLPPWTWDADVAARVGGLARSCTWWIMHEARCADVVAEARTLYGLTKVVGLDAMPIDPGVLQVKPESWSQFFRGSERYYQMFTSPGSGRIGIAFGTNAGDEHELNPHACRPGHCCGGTRMNHRFRRLRILTLVVVMLLSVLPARSALPTPVAQAAVTQRPSAAGVYNCSIAPGSGWVRTVWWVLGWTWAPSWAPSAAGQYTTNETNLPDSRQPCAASDPAGAWGTHRQYRGSVGRGMGAVQPSPCRSLDGEGPATGAKPPGVWHPGIIAGSPAVAGQWHGALYPGDGYDEWVFQADDTSVWSGPPPTPTLTPTFPPTPTIPPTPTTPPIPSPSTVPPAGSVAVRVQGCGQLVDTSIVVWVNYQPGSSGPNPINGQSNTTIRLPQGAYLSNIVAFPPWPNPYQFSDAQTGPYSGVVYNDSVTLTLNSATGCSGPTPTPQVTPTTAPPPCVSGRTLQPQLDWNGSSLTTPGNPGYTANPPVVAASSLTIYYDSEAPNRYIGSVSGQQFVMEQSDTPWDAGGWINPVEFELRHEQRAALVQDHQRRRRPILRRQVRRWLVQLRRYADWLALSALPA